MKFPYADRHDVEMRLNDSVILVDGEPCHVYGTSGDINLHCTNMETGKEFIVDYRTSNKIDLTPTPLGFVNRGPGCSYVARVPTRKNKQGLSLNNMVSTNRPCADLIRSKELSRCIKGIYPSLEEVITSVTKAGSMAFHRRFALARKNFILDEIASFTIYLLYKSVGPVGVLKDGLLYLFPKFEYLNSLLLEVVGDKRYAGVQAPE